MVDVCYADLRRIHNGMLKAYCALFFCLLLFYLCLSYTTMSAQSWHTWRQLVNWHQCVEYSSLKWVAVWQNALCSLALRSRNVVFLDFVFLCCFYVIFPVLLGYISARLLMNAADKNHCRNFRHYALVGIITTGQAEYSTFESTLNSPIVSYRIVNKFYNWSFMICRSCLKIKVASFNLIVHSVEKPV